MYVSETLQVIQKSVHHFLSILQNAQFYRWICSTMYYTLPLYSINSIPGLIQIYHIGNLWNYDKEKAGDTLPHYFQYHNHNVISLASLTFSLNSHTLVMNKNVKMVPERCIVPPLLNSYLHYVEHPGNHFRIIICETCF